MMLFGGIKSLDLFCLEEVILNGMYLFIFFNCVK